MKQVWCAARRLRRDRVNGSDESSHICTKTGFGENVVLSPYFRLRVIS